MLQGRPVALACSQHASQLGDPALIVERSERHARPTAAGALRDMEVPIGDARDLRQVGYAQHLGSPAQLCKLAANGMGGLASDAGVDLV